jgi:hypothetical protein
LIKIRSRKNPYVTAGKFMNDIKRLREINSTKFAPKPVKGGVRLKLRLILSI